MVSTETLQQMMEDAKELSTSQHNLILNRIEHLEKRLDEKIVPLEESSKEWQKYKHYIVAVATIISVVASCGVQILF